MRIKEVHEHNRRIIIEQSNKKETIGDLLIRAGQLFNEKYKKNHLGMIDHITVAIGNNGRFFLVFEQSLYSIHPEDWPK